MEDFIADGVGRVLISGHGAQLDQDDVPGGHVDSADERDGALAGAGEELFSDRVEAMNGRDASGQRHVCDRKAAGQGIVGGTVEEFVDCPVLNGLTAEVSDDG